MAADNRKRIDRARDALAGVIPDPKRQAEQIAAADDGAKQRLAA